MAQRVERWTCDQHVVGSIPARGKAALQPWASCSHLCASVTKQYNLVSAKWRWCSAAGKVTAGLAKSNSSLPPGGWLIVTCRLTACTPGSALGPTLGNEYWKPLPFLLSRLPSAYRQIRCSGEYRQLTLILTLTLTLLSPLFMWIP